VPSVARQQRSLPIMNRQILTISADAGALRVIAIWQNLQECAANVCAWKAHVDAQRGAESLTLEFADVSDAHLQNVVATLKDSTFPMKATIRHTPEV
jgi:hypothetical protein